VRIRAWDVQAAGGALAPPDPTPHRLAVWPGDDGPAVCTTWQPDFGLLLVGDQDPDGIGQVAVVADAERLPWWEPGAPLRQLLAWGLAPHHRHFLHAAAVGSPDGVVLLAGAGGAGKSSTAISCLLAGMGYLGDDYCVVTLDGAPVAHCLYGTAKLLPDQVAVVDPQGRLAAHVLHRGAPEDEKVTVLAAAVAGEQLVRHAPVVAVVVPDTMPPPGLRASTAGTALRHLAPTSLFQLAGHGQDDLRAMAAVVRRVPAFRLGLDPDRQANPPLLRGLLHDLGVGA
jgi:hypothetical protein